MIRAGNPTLTRAQAVPQFDWFAADFGGHVFEDSHGSWVGCEDQGAEQ